MHDTPITLGPHDTAGEALSLLPKRAHGAVIVVEDGRPVGVVTEADCQGVDRFTQLRQVMSRDLVTLPAGTDPRAGVRPAARGPAPAGARRGRRRARCVGILTRTGALRATLYQPAAGRLGAAAASPPRSA